MNRHALALTWLLCLVPQAAAQQVVTQEELAQSGITRLGDLFQLSDSWTASSIDGYAWDAAALGRAPEQASSWQLFVNEVPVDLRALGRANLSMLPVAVTEVCMVELHTHPVLIGGVLAPFGAVHVHMCPPESGLIARGAVAAGSESGDPGPYKYLQQGDRNVDRSGPAMHAAAMFKKRGTHFRVAAQLDEHHATDPLIRPRVRTLYRGEKDARIHHRAASLDFSHHGRGRLAAWAAATRLEDLRFFDRLGLEAPVNHDLLLGHLSGSLWGPKVDFQLSAQRMRVVTRPNPLHVTADWNQTAVHGMLRRHFRSHTALGLRSSALRTWGMGMKQHQVLLLHRVFVQVDNAANRPVALGVHLEASLQDGTLGIKALGTAHFVAQSVRLAALWMRQAPAAVQGPLYWNSLGYHPGGLPPEQAWQLPQVLTTQSADLSWQSVDTPVKIRLSGSVLRHADYPIMHYMHRYDSLTTGLQPTVSYVAATGLAASAGGLLEARVLSRLSLSVFGRYVYPVSAEHAFRASWRTRSQMRIQIRYRSANSRFSLWGVVRYRGSSSWPEYTIAAVEAPDRYLAALPGALLADLTIQKRFWRQRLRVSASLRNLLNRPHRTHPGGASSRLALHMRVQYRLRAFAGS